MRRRTSFGLRLHHLDSCSTNLCLGDESRVLTGGANRRHRGLAAQTLVCWIAPMPRRFTGRAGAYSDDRRPPLALSECRRSLEDAHFTDSHLGDLFVNAARLAAREPGVISRRFCQLELLRVRQRHTAIIHIDVARSRRRRVIGTVQTGVVRRVTEIRQFEPPSSSRSSARWIGPRSCPVSYASCRFCCLSQRINVPRRRTSNDAKIREPYGGSRQSTGHNGHTGESLECQFATNQQIAVNESRGRPRSAGHTGLISPSGTLSSPVVGNSTTVNVVRSRAQRCDCDLTRLSCSC